MAVNNEKLVDRLLAVMEKDVIPLTQKGVTKGDKVFGAAILRKDDLSLVIAGTNAETENPLWHGEVHTLKEFYEMPRDARPATRDCVFFATHEPCPLCLSAITWTGFDNFYYLFGYVDTKDTFNIPHDLKILKEVFKIDDGNYARDNAYWKSYSVMDMISALPSDKRAACEKRVRAIEAAYNEMSETYQSNKDDTDIPLS